MDDHARRLVDRNYVVVFVKDIQRDGFRFRAHRRARLYLDGDALSAMETIGAFRGLPVHENERRVDQFLHARAAQIGTARGDHAIQPLAGFFRKNNEIVRHVVSGIGDISLLRVRKLRARGVWHRKAHRE